MENNNLGKVEYQKCPYCDGTGMFFDSHNYNSIGVTACYKCGGTGVIPMGIVASSDLKQKINNPIVDICGDTVDLRKVERVGEIGGDNYWLRYTVYFTGGGEMEINHQKKYADNRVLRQMKREDFIELWKSFNQ